MRTLLLGVLAVLAGCAAPAPLSDQQGWSGDVRRWMYAFDQGSRIMPFAWLAALESEAGDGADFIADGLARFGYIPRPKDALNPEGLPVGFTAGVERATGRLFVGMNCTACHTAQVVADGRTMLIDGAPGNGDFQGFIQALSAALTATAGDDARFARFAARIVPPPARAAVQTQAETFAAYVAQSRTAVAWGPGRNDAFGMILNRVTSLDAHVPANARAPDAPTSYPYLWTTHAQDWIQWNGGVANTRWIERLGRNVGQVLGVFGRTPGLDPPVTGETIASSVEVWQLLRAETAIAQLDPPAWPWPEDRLQGEALTRAVALYDRECAACHWRPAAAAPRAADWRGRTLPSFRIPVDRACHLGGTLWPPLATDARAVRKLNGLPVPGAPEPWQPQLGTLSGLANNGLGTSPTARGGGTAMLRLAVQRVIADPGAWQSDEPVAAGNRAPYRPSSIALDIWGRFLDGSAISGARPSTPQVRAETERLAYQDASRRVTDPQDCAPTATTYKAGPLAGIWATGPFLHNGSVPTLADLLEPADRRPTAFRVGGREIDRERVGFVEAPDGFVFRVENDPGCASGNCNRGHEYGTLLPPAEKAALLAYLRML